VLKVVNLLAAEVDSNGSQALAGVTSSNIYVPDTRSVLMPLQVTLFNDAPWLEGRVDPARMRIVHPKVSVYCLAHSAVSSCLPVVLVLSVMTCTSNASTTFTELPFTVPHYKLARLEPVSTCSAHAVGLFLFTSLHRYCSLCITITMQHSLMYVHTGIT
jgi:hypothetical protein